jgi:hypothetical protein
MNKRLNFKRLWLISERDQTARKQEFSKSKTLLLGKNGTGKSRITKHLFWVFGCDPIKRAAGTWDPDIIAGLDFSLDDLDYFVLRKGKRLALFDSQFKLLLAADEMRSWDNLFAQFIGYKLQLQRHGGSAFAQAGPTYLTLPFYMDQDGSWGADWDTYSNLTQFKDWKKPTFEAFIGMRPNAYFEAKLNENEAKQAANEFRNELNAQKNAFKRVHNFLPKNVPSLSLSTFRNELADLAKKSAAIQRLQIETRNKLLVAVNLRQKLHSELQLVMAAYKDVAGDLAFISEAADKAIECPTCGTIHENSFHARLQLSQDAESMSSLITELKNEIRLNTNREAGLRDSLRKIEKQIGEIEIVGLEKKSKLKLDDVLASHSKKTLDVAFNAINKDMSSQLKLLEEHQDKLHLKVQLFEDKERIKNVKNYYASQVSSISNLLNVPSDEQIATPKPSARANAGGSSAPRSMLAVHLAMLATNIEHGDTPLYPFVVDTPQQSGQDDVNLKKMIEVLGGAAGINHQVILALETLPPEVDTSGFKVLELTKPKSILSAEEYLEVASYLKGPLSAMNCAIDEANKES